MLIAEYRNDHTVVLLIDEAQNIPIETLESIRMLSNLETATEKLIQMVLVGQPELDELLNRYELRQVLSELSFGQELHRSPKLRVKTTLITGSAW